MPRTVCACTVERPSAATLNAQIRVLAGRPSLTADERVLLAGLWEQWREAAARETGGVA